MIELVSPAEIAAMLQVPRARVKTWVSRADRNGFPKPEVTGIIRRYDNGLRRTRLWDAAAVKKWHEAYAPSRGGRPFAKV